MLRRLIGCRHEHHYALTRDWTQFHRDNMQRWNPYEQCWASTMSGTETEVAVSCLGLPTLAGSGERGGLCRRQLRQLYALNASTGALLWSASNDAQSSAMANGVVYVGGGGLYALNASTGALLWSYPVGRIVLSAPTVANRVVYFGNVDKNCCVDVFNGLYALNASTGALLWSYRAPGSIIYGPPGFVYSSAAVANGSFISAPQTTTCMR